VSRSIPNTPSPRRWLIQAVLGLVTLPLSAVPIWIYATHTADGRIMWLKARYQLLPPGMSRLSPAAAAVAVRDRSTRVDGVPVLVYHGIGQVTDTFDRRYSVSREHFGQQLQALQLAGYHPIRVEQLVQYLRTDQTVGLPTKPILITFADGTTDAMLQADPLLAATHMRATMFVNTDQASSGSFFYEQWGALASYASSGRWQLENHSANLHYVDRHYGRLISRLVDPAPGESLAAYRARVAADLDAASGAIQEHTGGHVTAFAYPYGEWGQNARPGVARALAGVLRTRFAVAFDEDRQSGWRPALPGDPRLHIHRLEVMDWSGPQLLARLDAAAKLGNAVYAERGLDHTYTPIVLLNAAKRYRCTRRPGAVLRGRTWVPRKELALSFDDGPSVYTPQILDVLERAHAHATFFVTGYLLRGRARILSRMLADGDEIGNGTASEASLVGRSSAAIDRSIGETAAAIARAVPVRPCLVRPPYGEGATRVAPLAAHAGERTALWSADPRDFASQTPGLIARRVLALARPGAIVVLHDGGSDRWATVQALPGILAVLAERGYQVTTISNLYRLGNPATPPAS
jgi:peptidoglycan-N-acetylglucosamine deacetylase